MAVRILQFIADSFQKLSESRIARADNLRSLKFAVEEKVRRVQWMRPQSSSGTRSQAFTKGQSRDPTIVGYVLCVTIRKVPRLSLMKYGSRELRSARFPARTRVDIHTKPRNVARRRVKVDRKKVARHMANSSRVALYARRRVFRSSAIVRNAEGDAWEIFHFLPGGRDCIETGRASIKSTRNRWSAVATPRARSPRSGVTLEFSFSLLHVAVKITESAFPSNSSTNLRILLCL